MMFVDEEKIKAVPLSTENPDTRFETICQIGSGSFGAVYRCKDRATGEFVAVKQIPINHDDDLDKVAKEINIMRQLSNRNVVQYRDAYRAAECLWIAMEFCSGGSIDLLLKSMKEPLPEPTIAYICREVLQGLAYLHSKKTIHRDIKAGNVLVSLSDGQVKLADFGVSAQLTHTVSKRRTGIGTFHWMAPEAISECTYNERADIWSLGITAIEMAELAPPYASFALPRLMNTLTREPPPVLKSVNRWTPLFHRFLARCLTKDPEKRPSAVELLSDPFVSNLPDSAPQQLVKLIETARAIAEKNSSAGNNEGVANGGGGVGADSPNHQNPQQPQHRHRHHHHHHDDDDDANDEHLSSPAAAVPQNHRYRGFDSDDDSFDDEDDDENHSSNNKIEADLDDSVVLNQTKNNDNNSKGNNDGGQPNKTLHSPDKIKSKRESTTTTNNTFSENNNNNNNNQKDPRSQKSHQNNNKDNNSSRKLLGSSSQNHNNNHKNQKNYEADDDDDGGSIAGLEDDYGDDDDDEADYDFERRHKKLGQAEIARIRRMDEEFDDEIVFQGDDDEDGDNNKDNNYDDDDENMNNNLMKNAQTLNPFGNNNRNLKKSATEVEFGADEYYVDGNNNNNNSHGNNNNIYKNAISMMQNYTGSNSDFSNTNNNVNNNIPWHAQPLCFSDGSGVAQVPIISLEEFSLDELVRATHSSQFMSKSAMSTMLSPSTTNNGSNNNNSNIKDGAGGKTHNANTLSNPPNMLDDPSYSQFTNNNNISSNQASITNVMSSCGFFSNNNNSTIELNIAIDDQYLQSLVLSDPPMWSAFENPSNLQQHHLALMQLLARDNLPDANELNEILSQHNLELNSGNASVNASASSFGFNNNNKNNGRGPSNPPGNNNNQQSAPIVSEIQQYQQIPHPRYVHPAIQHAQFLKKNSNNNAKNNQQNQVNNNGMNENIYMNNNNNNLNVNTNYQQQQQQVQQQQPHPLFANIPFVPLPPGGLSYTTETLLKLYGMMKFGTFEDTCTRERAVRAHDEAEKIGTILKSVLHINL